MLRYEDALAHCAATTLGPEWRRDLDEYAEMTIPGLTSAPAFPTLVGRLALRELDGNDARDLLWIARGRRGLGDAVDAAAVLDHRLGPPTNAGPLPWLPAVPARLQEGETGEYLRQRSARVADLAAAIRADHPSSLDAEIAVWRAAYAIPDGEALPTGPPTDGAGSAYQRDLDRRLRSATGDHLSRHDWTEDLPADVLADPRRGMLLDRLDQLAAAHADVPDLIGKALARGPLPTEVPADALWWRLARLHRPAEVAVLPKPEPPLSRHMMVPHAPPVPTSRHDLGYAPRDRGRGYSPRI